MESAHALVDEAGISDELITRWARTFAKRHLLAGREADVEILIRNFLAADPSISSTVETAFEALRQILERELGEPADTVAAHIRGVVRAERMLSRVLPVALPQPTSAPAVMPSASMLKMLLPLRTSGDAGALPVQLHEAFDTSA